VNEGKRGERLTSSSEYFLVSGKKRYTEGKITSPFKAAKRAYVPHRMFANIGPVAMTTWLLAPSNARSNKREKEGRKTHHKVEDPITCC
jgi:hypothetical protein